MSPFRDTDGRHGDVAIYDFAPKLNSGERQPLADYRGKVLLIVNVASKCGFTPQYKDLQRLYERYRDRGFEVLGFPCDQFGHQEPGSDAEIRSFCDAQYTVTFPLFSKIRVNGSGEDPLYAFLKSEKGGLLTNAIKWNFTKFLVSREGKVVRRYAPAIVPEKIAADIESELVKPANSVHHSAALP
jgi:glutathione peroxidase